MMNAGLGAIAPNANPMAAQPQPFKELLALNEAVKAANLARAAQGQQAMAQAQQQPPTVKDQLMMALEQALGASNYGYAGGGIVAFADGGDINPADLEALDADIMADEFAGFGATPEQMAADELRVQEAPTRQRIQELESRIRELETRSPLNTQLPPLRQELARLKGALVSAPPAPAAAGAPRPAPAPAGAGAPAALPAPPPLVRLQSLTPSASGAPRPSPAAGAATGLGAGAGAGADAGTSPAAGQIDLSNLSAAQKALAELVGQRGAVSPAVAAAREELDRLSRTALDPAEQQLRELEAQQRRGVFSDPEALMEMLAGMGETPMTFGQALAGAGRGAAKTRAGREARIRDARSKLNQLRSDLALTQARERMARAEGDDRAVRDYKIKEAEIKAQIQATSVDLQFKQEDLEVRRRQVGAQERQAAAAEESARNRPTTEDRGETAKRKAISDAIEVAQKAVPIPTGVTGPARQRMIDRQVEMVAQQVAPYGVTRDEVLRYFATPGPASGATTSTQGWGQPQVVPKP
jgi:hypothetical protein